jgi:hypothetical protein
MILIAKIIDLLQIKYPLWSYRFGFILYKYTGRKIFAEEYYCPFVNYQQNKENSDYQIPDIF